MFRHHLLIAYRNLQRHKGSFLINWIGLSTGLACTFLIFLWVNDELHFDKFHTKDKQLFQVMETSKENSNIIVHDNTQGPLARAMVKDLPEVVSAVGVMSLEKEGMYLPLRTGEKSIKTTGVFADSGFFTIFSFPLVHGDPTQVLKEKNAMVISENIAQSLFGSVDNAIGKPIEWEILGMKRQSSVSGVFKRLPENNSMKFDFVLSYDMMMTELAPNFQKWSNEGPTTYIVMKEGADIPKFNAKITNYLKKYDEHTNFTLFVRPYSSAYLYGNYENGLQAGGRIGYVKLFSIIAIFILLIACINFMNLSTAKATRRLKEVGIKKTMGSTRNSLILQFLSEAMVMAFLSLIGSCIIVSLFLPFFNQLTGKNLVIHFTPGLITLVLGATLFTGFISGSYPAFYLSGFNPVAVLKGKLRNSFGELLARRGLVVFQFVVSLVLIISVIVVYRQVDYVQSQNPGYDKANVIYFDKDGTINQNQQAFLSELKKIPGVANASAIENNVVQNGGGSATYGIDWPGKNNKELIDFSIRSVDYGMLDLLSVQMAQGRTFSKDFGSEDSKLIFNETAIKAMGLKDPIGTPIKMWGKDATIIGVVKDFHVSSLHERIAPMVFRYDPNHTMTIMAKIAADKQKETIAQVETFYKQFNPGFVFEYKFLDNTYQAQYVSERRISTLSRYFAGLAILISCLGLFGLAAFNAEIRTKEIGIRKALGASVTNVILLLSRDFIRLIILAVLIAFPLAWWAMNTWLGGFAYHIQIGAGEFVLAGISILVFALLTVSYQSIRTALRNPADSLRSE